VAVAGLASGTVGRLLAFRKEIVRDTP